MTSISQAASPSRIARLTRAVARATAPMSRPLAGRRLFPLWAVLHHRGRRSGRQYAIPVAVRVTPDAFVIALPWGERTQWVSNVIAAEGCTIRWRGATHEITHPRLIGLAEAADAFSPVQRWILRAAGVSSFVHLRRDATTTLPSAS